MIDVAVEPLAKDFTGLLNRFGAALRAAVERRLVPLHRPGIDPTVDLSPLERCRTRMGGKAFHFFPSQKDKIGGAIKGLKANQRVWFVMEMGSGKSPCALATAWDVLHTRKKPYRLLIMCPGHLVKKWAREVTWLLPDVNAHVIQTFADLRHFERIEKTSTRPMVAVIGKDTAKLGYNFGQPCASKKLIFEQVLCETKDDLRPGDRNEIDAYSDDGNYLGVYVDRKVAVATCPKCGAIATDEDDGYILFEDYLAFKQLKTHRKYLHPVVTCTCGETLGTCARGYNKHPHVDRYIQRKMKGIFDLFIADEVHELDGAETAQGHTFGTLAASCKYTLALTGSLIGGRASDLHAPMWRMAPGLLRQRGFNLKNLRGQKLGPIARNVTAFLKRYGVFEYQVHRGIADEYGGRVNSGAASRRKEYRSEDRPRPGISPNLFNHFLLNGAVFMSLDELGPALPKLERELISCPMTTELHMAYQSVDDQLSAAIKEKSHNGKGPPVLAGIRVQVLDNYLDAPWGWDPIEAPVYEHGEKVGTVEVAWPQDLGALREDRKDDKVVEVVRRELQAGRKCAIYPQFVGKHDVRSKLMGVLTRAGVRAVCLPDSVKPAAREEWIQKRANSIDVLIVHPKRVMTGLDLIEFPTLIWYQVGYSTHVLRQASARARRPIQTRDCKVIYLYYGSTIQEQALGLMGEKESASQALEGVFDPRALRAMMNGGKNDDILAALANNLSNKVDAQAAWSNVRDDAGPLSEDQAIEDALDFFLDIEVPHEPPARERRKQPVHTTNVVADFFLA